MNSKTAKNKRFYIYTLGCKVNQYESQAMRELLTQAGFMECLSKELADIYIINTCTVTQRADKESRHLIGSLHRTNPKALIVVTGCYVEKNTDDISFLPGVSYIIRNEDKARIVDILGSEPTDYVDSPSERAKDRTVYRERSAPSLKVTGLKDHAKVFVKIQDGCENACSYCKIPLVRGPLRSKPLKDIIDEVKGIVDNGYMEIILTGICLGAWGEEFYPQAAASDIGPGPAGLVDVLMRLDSIPGNFRVRLSSIEPKYVTSGLIDYMAGSPRICRHLHIPLQSGDDEVLRLMNRLYTTKEYAELIAGIRAKMPDISITTDVLVGFPGEAEKNFENTVRFVKDLMPARTHIFTFSRRRYTAAYGMANIVKNEELKRRYGELNEVAQNASYLFKRKFLNETLDVLVEEKRDKVMGLLMGYTGNYIKVFFKGPDELIRKIAPVRIYGMGIDRTFGIYEPK